MHGFDVLKRIKADKTAAERPVIIISNLSDEDGMRKGRELGAVDYMVKANFAPDQMVERIEEAFTRSDKNIERESRYPV